jgi:hypothetical protein
MGMIALKVFDNWQCVTNRSPWQLSGAAHWVGLDRTTSSKPLLKIVTLLEKYRVCYSGVKMGLYFMKFSQAFKTIHAFSRRDD